MSRPQLVIGAAVLFALHTLEELTESFSSTDTWSLAAAHLTHTNSATVYLVGQLVLFGFLAWLIINQPTANGWYWLLGGIMLFELDHVIRSISSHTYYPGLGTAVFLLLWMIPYSRALRWRTQ